MRKYVLRNRLSARSVTAVLTLGLLLANGCGGDGSDGTKTSNSTSPTTTSTTTTTTTTTTTITTTTTTLPAWTGTAGSLSSFSWHAPAVDPDSGHAFGYGGVNYAPNGDLYLFYNKVVGGSNELDGVIRRNGSSMWTSESYLAPGDRTANVYFTASGVPHVATESGMWAYIYDSPDYNTSTVHWNQTAGFASSYGHQGAYENAFVTMNGTDLNLYWTYFDYSPVTGADLYVINYAMQSSGTWNIASGGWPGTFLGPAVPFVTANHGVTGAFQDPAGKVLVLSSQAFLSTDYGQNFTQIKNTDVEKNNLNGVIAATQNPTDNSIVIANVYRASYSTYGLRIWGTRDYGATFSSLTDIPLSDQSFHGAIVSVQNLIVVAVATGTTAMDGTALDTGISVMTSYDGGATWSALTQLVDATAGGHSTYTLAGLKLTADPNTGSVVLMYSLKNGTTREGVYLKEFY